MERAINGGDEACGYGDDILSRLAQDIIALYCPRLDSIVFSMNIHQFE